MCASHEKHALDRQQRADTPVPGIPARIGLGLIWIYRHSLSLVMGRGCRYAPTCSEYTADALKTHGLWAGGWIGLARILRCNPWGASGFDPIPERLPGNAAWYLPWRYARWNGEHISKETRLD
ncbi:membrane protein insertion efficiency factor YidD [Roseibium sp. RKSG952]|uniref:membrane protein insertion efficiency factor YidD n=1 Tax=Roseibium sp. RKSG952 TaxID=2529384 RepID=UPI0012BB8D65|nr:membrane protein insertion efficiency factor YidD [Roseibium sp. RKSG952]MTH99408.1 membrane protein insertion efficiency factor YidD [Roseibium sp. RKSG952]